MAERKPYNAIIINGVTYKVMRTNNIAGYGPDPCSLCDILKLCGDKGRVMPCDLFHRGHMLAHFKKLENKPSKKTLRNA